MIKTFFGIVLIVTISLYIIFFDPRNIEEEHNCYLPNYSKEKSYVVCEGDGSEQCKYCKKYIGRR